MHSDRHDQRRVRFEGFSNSIDIQAYTSAVLLFISVLAIIIRITRHQLDKRKPKENESERLIDVDGEDGLSLQRTVSRVSTIFQDDKPQGANIVVFSELALLVGQVAISTLAVLSPYRGHRLSLDASLLFWVYLLLVSIIRLYFTTSARSWTWLKLWNHSAVLYGLRWFADVWTLRAAIVFVFPKRMAKLQIASFALTTMLVLIVLCSRRGNKTIKVEVEADIPPPREPSASILSRMTFAWCDPIIWQGFKKPLEMEDVWNVPFKDKAENVLDLFRQIQTAHGLALRLFFYFRKDILLQGLWCTIGSVFTFVPTLLLKAIVEYLEDPAATPRDVAWLYVIGLFASGVVQAVGDGQALWIGRKVCIRMRAIVIGEIYSKVLRRRAAAILEKESKNDGEAKAKTIWQRIMSWRRRDIDSAMKQALLDKKSADAPANNGTVINLMSIDSFKVANICSYLHFLWAEVPIQLTLAVYLLYRFIGYSSFVGLALMLLLLPVNVYLARAFQTAQKRIMKATDVRIHATDEVLQNIRIIKYFAWERRFEQTVNEKRETELNFLWRKYIVWASAYTVWTGAPVLMTLASFFVYTKIEKKPLIPSIAFPALSMFALLRVPLDQLTDMVAQLQEAKVSLDRVDKFLKEGESQKYSQLRNSRQASPHETKIALENATLSWTPPVPTDDDGGATESADTFKLRDMTVTFTIGKLNVIVGPTGSGKSSLLLALLGEMELLDGMVFVPGGYSRQTLRPDSDGLTESVAYCAQQAWLVNDTIKNNILFAAPFDEQRYKFVVSVCALAHDFEILDAGDDTLVGEKGITLSGGQKQRVSLARAIYSSSRHVMLDDCLSAVDSHTAKHIFHKAIMGPLMAGRTCILVSHNTTLTVPQAAHVVALENGRIASQGTPAHVMESGKLGDEMASSTPASGVASRIPSPTRSPGGSSDSPPGKDDSLSHGIESSAATESTGRLKAKKIFQDTRIEKKAEGSVELSTIIGYLRAMGPWWYWIFAATAFILVQIGAVATNVWIREWANAYHVAKTASKKQALLLAGFQFSPAHHSSLPQGFHAQDPVAATGYRARLGPLSAAEDVDVTYYLLVYAAISAVYIVVCFVREITLFRGSTNASRRIHANLLHSIMRATFKFFDSTPLGQMTNRFSRDLAAVDQEVAPVAIGFLHSTAATFAIVILIVVITPSFLIPGIFIAIIYVGTGMLYLRSSRDLKRMEAVQRSPLFQSFGETISGVITIRAYGDEWRFVHDVQKKVDVHNRPFIYLWAANRWLAFRIDIAGALVAFFSAVSIVSNVGTLDAGAAGLSLSYAITFSQTVLWVVRLYVLNEQNMNSVERIQEYIDTEQEAAAEIPATKPSSSWPEKGKVEFIDYTTRYRQDLDPVLRHISFQIDGAQKVGVVGRTGAGKSSLALALFRGLEAETGRILIDNVDIALLGLQTLREAITIVPQDPTLFTGTLRSNLDPFSLFTDEEIFTALRRVQLISSTKKSAPSSSDGTGSPRASSDADILENENVNTHDHAAGTVTATATVSSATTLVRQVSNSQENKNLFLDLTTPIAESGSNLSQGQRQLLCLARALLKAPKVLVMDEATASIDYATDGKIQDTLRELKGNTVITIAHRLQTIIDYDKVLVLDQGEVVEYDHPWNLINKENGSFRRMCETSGELETLLGLAKKAYDASRLVDV